MIPHCITKYKTNMTNSENIKESYLCIIKNFPFIDSKYRIFLSVGNKRILIFMEICFILCYPFVSSGIKSRYSCLLEKLRS